MDARAALLAADHVVPHTDADGLAAGALVLRARGQGAEHAVLLRRGETPFGADAPVPDGTLAVVDWGVRPIRAAGVIVDHHAPVSEPGPDVVVVSSYRETPETPTAPLVRRLLPEQPAWLAAVGAVGDLGDAGFALPECAGAGAKSPIKKLVALVNAPRRLPDGPVRTALALLVEHDSAQAALKDPRIAELDEAKRAWRAEFDRVVRTAPRVNDTTALLRFSSPAQVHPLVATTWSRRLAPRAVIAANDDYLPGRVNFAIRGGGDRDLRALLKEALPGHGGTEFANGHDRATGGSLSHAEFEDLLTALHL
jgi:single-stranded-DNA-specific exonuclease